MGQQTKWSCDNCGKIDSHDDMFPPTNWVQLNVSGSAPRWFCSAECLADEAKKMEENKTLEKLVKYPRDEEAT